MGQSHLAGVYAALAGETEALGHPRLGAIALDIGHIGKRAIDGRMDVGRIAAGDAVWLEHIAQAQLQAGNARVGGGHRCGRAQRLRCFDIQQQPDRLVHAIGPLGPLQRRHGGANVVGRLRLGQVQQRQARPGHGLQISLEMRRAQRIDAHDDQLGRVAGRVGCHESLHRGTGRRLRRLGHRVFQIDGEGVGRAGQGLVEKLRPHTRDEQFAPHHGPQYGGGQTQEKLSTTSSDNSFSMQ